MVFNAKQGFNSNDKKRFNPIVFLFLLCFLSSASTHAQFQDRWRFHFNYELGLDLAYGNNQVFMSNGEALLIYDEQTGQVTSLNESNGLNSTGISAIAFHPERSAVIVAYRNSSIDIIDAQSLNVDNIPDIENELLSGSKTINQILVTTDGQTYLATDFGIIALDLENLEIDNTFVIGSDGSPVEVYGVAFGNERLFAATDEGVKVSRTGDVNLLDFSNWTHSQNNLSPSGDFLLASTGDSIYATRKDSLFLYADTTWTLLYSDSTYRFERLMLGDERVYGIRAEIDTAENVIGRSVVKWSGGAWSVIDSTRDFVRDYIATSTTSGYLASATRGLLRNNNGELQNINSPNAPFSNLAYSIHYFQNRIYASAGNVNTFFVPAAFYQWFLHF